ncbi:MAG: GAF domain-containing protein, partial [Candidatus Eremiobacteraeota bacterium]|nr:GAF domain-containing protein [Candidatus Eremiobacteraeota bacterium]
MWDSLVAFARAVREGRLTKTQRRASIAVLMLAEIGVGYLDYADPGLRLAPSAVLFVISIAAIGGAIPGIIAALLAAICFSLAESRDTFEGFITHAGLRMLSYLLAAGVVVLIRRQASALRRSEARVHDLELTAARAEVQAAEASFRAVGEAIPFGVWYADARGRLLYMSDSFLQLIGASISDVRDHWIDRVRPQDAQRIRKSWSGREEWPDLWEDEYVVSGVDGRKYSVLCRGSAVRDERGELKGWAGLNLDVTDRTRAREQLTLLADAGRLLSLSLDSGAILERVAHLVVPRLADWCELHLVREDGAIATPVVTHADPSKDDLARRLATIERHRDDGGPVAGVIRTGKSLLIEAVTASDAAGDERLEILRALAPRSALIVPLRVRGSVFGAMSAVQAESGRTFTADDVEFFEILAARTALSYENARVYARERRVATTLQRASLPTVLPQVPGIRVKAAYVPGASESEIGGDWYDAFTLADGKLGISIGDVAGKGLRAAIAMSNARQALRAAALEGSGPAQALRRVNKLLCLE